MRKRKIRRKVLTGFHLEIIHGKAAQISPGLRGKETLLRFSKSEGTAWEEKLGRNKSVFPSFRRYSLLGSHSSPEQLYVSVLTGGKKLQNCEPGDRR